MKPSVKAFLLVALVFLIGAAMGTGATLLYMKTHPRAFRALFFQAPPQTSDIIREEFTRRLRLDPEQERKLLDIWDRYSKRFQAIEDEFKEALRTELEQMREEMAPYLTPEQREFLLERLTRPPRHPLPPPPAPR